jgi:hypothetical protein
MSSIFETDSHRLDEITELLKEILKQIKEARGK